MGGSKIQYLDSPHSSQDAATKKYVDDKTSTNSTNITSLAVRVTTLESIKRVYTYHFDYTNLSTSWAYPTSNAANLPYHWMFCKGLNSSSRFHIHTFSYDADSSLDSNYTITFKLDFFDTSGNHTPKEIFTVRKGDKTIPGERLLFIDEKFNPSTLTGYQNFVMTRLAVKGSSNKGNEFVISCSFEI